MIPNFKTYINESVWSDIHKRSNGITARKEDTINSNEDLKNKIKELYKEQGEGDTLDISSLSKLIACDNFYALFHNFTNVKQIIGLDTWDVSNVTNMCGMFQNCSSLTELNISNWDVSNVTDMSYMFLGCESLTELNISNWDVSNVTDMRSMFRLCISLKELNISNWDVSNVTDMSYMFNSCNKLIKSKWYKDE